MPNEPTRIVVQPDFSVLTPGAPQTGVITLLFSDGSVRNVKILTVVAPGSTVGASAASKDYRAADGCTPSQLLPQFTSLSNGFVAALSQPTTIEVKLIDNCGAAMTQGSATSYFSNGDSPLKLVHTRDGFWTGTWQPRNASQSQVQIAIQAFTSSGQGIIGGKTDSPLSGAVSPGARIPLVNAGAVQNAASFVAQSPLAPGSLITIFGTQLADGREVASSNPLQTVLSGTEVVMTGRSLPLLYVSDGQVNAQIPYELPVNTEHQLLVRRGTALSVPESITIAAAQPAIYTKDQSGRGAGVIVNGNNVVVSASAPARAGDTVVIYCNGVGAVTPAVPSGSAAPLAGPLSRTVIPVSVTIGGIPARVDFAGLTPGFAGLYQVNAVVPQGVAPGNEVAVVLSVAGQTSPPVTMAVR